MSNPSTPQESLAYRIGYVCNCLTTGRLSLTAQEYCHGKDSRALRHGVWKRARLNARLAIALPDAWKEDAENYAREQGRLGESTLKVIREARQFYALPKEAVQA